MLMQLDEDEQGSCIPSVKQMLTQLPQLSAKDKAAVTKALSHIFDR